MYVHVFGGGAYHAVSALAYSELVAGGKQLGEVSGLIVGVVNLRLMSMMGFAGRPGTAVEPM